MLSKIFNFIPTEEEQKKKEFERACSHISMNLHHTDTETALRLYTKISEDFKAEMLQRRERAINEETVITQWLDKE